MKANTLSRIVAGLFVTALLALAPAASSDARQDADVQPAAAAEGADVPTVPVKKIKLYVENWKFIPNVIRVKQGTKVVIDFVSRDASHSFVLKGYKLKVPLPEGKTGKVEFVADKVGTFGWRCGRPCGNGCPKMTGKLIVEE